MSTLQKAFSTDWKEWNHPWVATAMSVVFAILGFTAGYVVFAQVVPVDSELIRGLGLAAFGGIGIVAGSVGLALVD